MIKKKTSYYIAMVGYTMIYAQRPIMQRQLHKMQIYIYYISLVFEYLNIIYIYQYTLKHNQSIMIQVYVKMAQ